MALMDSADLLARCKRTAKRPGTDSQIADGDWYAWLTEAQIKWVPIVASVAPEQMYGAPTKITSSDSGVTYDFPSDPLGQVEVRESPTGRLWIPCAQWESGGDFVHEGNRIRFPDGKAKTFTDGPYARWVAAPTTISASVEPTLKPTNARLLLVHQACVYYAEQGGNRDPRPFERRLRDLWYGDPDDPRTPGLMDALKKQYAYSGAVAQPSQPKWYQAINSGQGYVVQR